MHYPFSHDAGISSMPRGAVDRGYSRVLAAGGVSGCASAAFNEGSVVNFGNIEGRNHGVHS